MQEVKICPIHQIPLRLWRTFDGWFRLRCPECESYRPSPR